MEGQTNHRLFNPQILFKGSISFLPDSLLAPLDNEDPNILPNVETKNIGSDIDLDEKIKFDFFAHSKDSIRRTKVYKSMGLQSK